MNMYHTGVTDERQSNQTNKRCIFVSMVETRFFELGFTLPGC
jgi:hypothetical protein